MNKQQKLMKTDNMIRDRCFNFALKIVELYTHLSGQKEYVISNQLLKSGTGIGANRVEALAGQSRKDFLHKMSIASKESRETRYWLRLLDNSELTKICPDDYLGEIEL